MPLKSTPRSLRDEVMFDLDEMLGELQQSAEALTAIQHALDHEIRRLPKINRLRQQVVEGLRTAQNLEDDEAMKWDGTLRRSTDIAWDPRVVAA